MLRRLQINGTAGSSRVNRPVQENWPRTITLTLPHIAQLVNRLHSRRPKGQHDTNSGDTISPSARFLREEMRFIGSVDVVMPWN